jgi:hypothetical protein
MEHHIGRLLWLILSAAGDTDIGEDPSIEASNVARLTEDGLNQLLQQGARWVGPNVGIFPVGKVLTISCVKDGTFLLSPAKDLAVEGKWWISGDRFYFKILGLRSYFHIVQDGNTIKLFDETGTLFGIFQQS